MELITSLRTLWRFRLVVLALGLLSCAVGLTLAYRIEGPTSFTSRQYQVGVASAQALVDTPSSQVADLGSEDTVNVDIATLSARAGLLANLMTTSPMKEEIAARAGIAPDALIAVPPASAEPGAAAAGGANPGVKIDPNDPNAHILKVTIPELQSGQIPIIAIRTQAPDEQAAARLANQAIAVLERRLSSVANDDRVPADRRVVVRRLGAAQTTLEAHGPGKTIAVAAALALFLLGCGLVLGLIAFIRSWRRAGELERTVGLEAADPAAPRRAATADDGHDAAAPSWALRPAPAAVDAGDWDDLEPDAPRAAHPTGDRGR